MSAVRYRITPIHPEAHLFEVELDIAQPAHEGQKLSLPAWIPGSYMIREFARHIVRIEARAGIKAVPLAKLDKHTWQAEPCEGPLRVRYEVYAWDLSVRAAHLDNTHGFFNGSSVFLKVHGFEDESCDIDIRPPSGRAYKDWRVATTLPEAPGRQGARRYGFGLYRAASYDELIDHPVEMGEFALHVFKACGVPHEIAITGRHDVDAARLCEDLKHVCEWQIRLFGEPAPFERYLFLVMAVGDGYGGLEHRSSTVLLCSRNDLPAPGATQMSDAYRGFLGLCSHEYFHSWNVKRIKPAAFVPYDLTTENYTRLLWAFEGFTSYYDDLALVRSGVIAQDDYLKLLGKTVTQVMRGSGRLKQSVAESSFDAWIKYYRQDENAPNAVVSYYTKGALVALALDLTLRGKSRGAVSLDDVMRRLWTEFGLTGAGVPEDGIRRTAEAVSGFKLKRFFEQATEGTEDLPLEELLKSVGLELSFEAAAPTPVLGARTANDGDAVRLTQVLDHGPAQRAGLSAGDVLVAMDGLRVTHASLDALLRRHQPGDELKVHAFRRDELMKFRVKLDAAPLDQAHIAPAARASRAAKDLLRQWLGRG
ncbi:M61 family metallopeptidase [Methyloversatilis thermotolerans]|uniref:M61 family metallopeptidase n=1 Tax=Methyloversatilis thermotolerans TaxID=1346290 RepID=UPI0003646B17|nr:M61 family metallopeptidase [Methyloversatilis thermotolerans]